MFDSGMVRVIPQPRQTAVASTPCWRRRIRQEQAINSSILNPWALWLPWIGSGSEQLGLD